MVPPLRTVYYLFVSVTTVKMKYQHQVKVLISSRCVCIEGLLWLVQYRGTIRKSDCSLVDVFYWNGWRIPNMWRRHVFLHRKQDVLVEQQKHGRTDLNICLIYIARTCEYLYNTLMQHRLLVSMVAVFQLLICLFLVNLGISGHFFMKSLPKITPHFAISP